MPKKNTNLIINTIDYDKVSLSGEYMNNKGYDFSGRDENYNRTVYLNINSLEIVHKLFFLLKTEFSPLEG